MQDTAGRTPLHMAAAYGAHPKTQTLYHATLNPHP